MEYPRMLYRHPGANTVDGISYDYLIVSESEAEQAFADGWQLSVAEAKTYADSQKASADDASDTLADKATALGIKIDKRWSTARLEMEIEKVEAAK